MLVFKRGTLALIGEIVIRKTKVLSSPDGSKYPFGLVFSPKDMAYSGREVVMKNNRFAPKKKHQSFDRCCIEPCQSFEL